MDVFTFHARKLVCLMLTATLMGFAGCATSWKNLDQNEDDTHTVDCSVAWSDIGYCLEQGGKVCGEAGYEIIDGDRNNLPDYDTWDFGLFDVPGLTRQMVIRCKKPQAVDEAIENKKQDETTVAQK